MNNEVLLSICILSYNQVDEVERTLKGLIGQVNSQVEVFIRDDSTNDDTAKLAEKYQQHFPIRYHKGKKEGIDRTVQFLTREAKGRFIWWMGDDEIVPQGVNMVLDVIKNAKSDLNFIWANYVMVNTELYGVNLPAAGYFESRDQLLELACVGLGFISATVFRRELALPHLQASDKYIGSLFVNLYLVLGVLSQEGKAYYLKGPAVICHPHTEAEVFAYHNKNVAKNPAFETFGINFYKIVKEFSGGFSAGAVRRTITKSFGMAWRGTVVGSVGGWDTARDKRARMMKYFWTFPQAWLALIVFSMPICFNRFLYNIYRKVKTSFKKGSLA